MNKSKKSSSMKKDIFDQPELINSSLKNRIIFSNFSIKFPEIENSDLDISSIDRIIFSGMGTSYNAALYGANIMEKIAKIPCKAVYASEMYHNDYSFSDKTLLISISQSGESSDVIQMMQEAKLRNIFQILVSESKYSKASKISDIFLPINSGPEYSIAATKTFSLSILLLLQLSIYFGDKRSISISKYLNDIRKIPSLLSGYLKDKKNINSINNIAKYLSIYSNIICLGRDTLFPIALEGALKIKETAYLHAEGYNPEELRHGTFALLCKSMPVLICANDSLQNEKNLSIVRDIISCESPVITILPEGEKYISKLADKVIFIPKSSEISLPFFNLFILQLLSYNLSKAVGNNPDQPRNLSKIVKL